MYASVVVCTRNRADQLAEFLQSAAGLSVPPGLTWELIIVDNGSSDHTAQVVESFASKIPVRCVREDRAGLSNARNRGVDEATGDYICWTDDDVMLDPEWLSAYVEAFQAHPEAAVFAGRILPVLAPPTPAWFSEIAGDWPITNVLAKRDFGETPIELDAERRPFGASYALRAAEQKRHRYNPHLGVSPNHKRVGEETDVLQRILAEGAISRWVPASKVHHITQPGRQSARYIYEYFLCAGETWAFLQHTQPERNFMGDNADERRKLLGAPISIVKTIVKHGVRYPFSRTFGSTAQWVADLRLLAIGMGAFSYWRKSRSA